MNRAPRWVAAGLVAVTTLAIVYLFQVRRYQCNAVKAALQAQTAQDWTSVDDFQVAQRTRTRVPELERCVAVVRFDPDMYMALALNYRLVGRSEEAAAAYENALLYDRRPEIFLNLGMTHLELNHHAAAVTNLAHAVAFDAGYAQYFHGEALQEQVAARAQALRVQAARR